MINKDLFAGMMIEMKSLGVYVPKPVEKEVAAPPTVPEAAPGSKAAAVPAVAAAAAAAGIEPAVMDGDSSTPSSGPAANGTESAVAANTEQFSSVCRSRGSKTTRHQRESTFVGIGSCTLLTARGKLLSVIIAVRDML